MTLERLQAYVRAGRERGVERLAVTEHLFRFREAYRALEGWWEADAAHPALAAAAAQYWRDHVSASVADYVRLVEQAKAAGLPVLLGIELDWIPGREEDLRRFLAPYDWDVVLGSVHWIGAWGFDILGHPVHDAEWERRDVDAVFRDYAALLLDLAASGLCDVLAHPDLPKLTGRRPASLEPFHRAILEAARRGGCALEVNGNGYHKPVGEPYPAPELLAAARAADIPITLASDAHEPERVGERFDELAAYAAAAGYGACVTFQARRPVVQALPAGRAG
ncbi:MAG TPA: histidinol-phosphatase [Dehalococcoidia bacterium]